MQSQFDMWMVLTRCGTQSISSHKKRTVWFAGFGYWLDFIGWGDLEAHLEFLRARGAEIQDYCVQVGKQVRNIGAQWPQARTDDCSGS